MTSSEPGEVVLEVPAQLESERVDRALSFLTGIPRRVAAQLISAGKVSVDGIPVSARSRAVRAGETIRTNTEDLAQLGPVPDENVEFGVVHEDAELIVVDKPAGLVVHPGAGSSSRTLVSGLLARYPELGRLPAEGAGTAERPGIVHRLDKGTSGLLVVARTASAYADLSRQFRTHSARREYTALVLGLVPDDRGIVEAPIGRSLRNPEKMTVSRSGRPARSEYAVLRRYGEASLTLLSARLTTGRTHQLRVHLAAIAHPVVGDDRYGDARARSALGEEVPPLEPGRLFLHASRLELEHPRRGYMQWQSPLPQDLEAVLEALGAAGALNGSG